MSDFQGIEYTVFFRGPVIYDSEGATEAVVGLVEEFLNERSLANRRGFPAGMGGAATGAPPFVELLLWLQENWELAAAAFSAVWAGIVKTRMAWIKVKKGFEQRVLDPYQPSIVVELRVCTTVSGKGGAQEAAESFRSMLTLVPDLSTLLRREIPNFGPTIRVITPGHAPRYPYVYFKVREVRDADVDRMLRFLDRRNRPSELSAVLLYRQFGFLTRLVESSDGREFMQLTSRS